MSKTIKWTIADGRVAEIDVAVAPELDSQGRATAGNLRRIDVRVTLGGQLWGSSINPIKHPRYAAACGDLAMRPEIYDQYLAAVAECKQSPEWVASEAIRAGHAAMCERVDASRRAIEATL